MNPFKNSNSTTWRGQQDSWNSAYKDTSDTQNSSAQSNAGPQCGTHPDNANSQDSPHPDNTETPNFSSGQNWMENPALAGIDPARLQMLSSFAAQAQSKKQNELLPFLMAAASQTNENGMSFRPDEIDTIISVMKIGKSPQEVQQIDRICSLMRQFRMIHKTPRRH